MKYLVFIIVTFGLSLLLIPMVGIIVGLVKKLITA